MQRLAFLIGFSLSVGVARPARGQAPTGCSGEKPWVSLSSRTPTVFAAAVRSELRAGLLPSNIEVCEPAPGASEPLAHVTLEAASVARYRLEVTDSVTQKRVSREIGLDKLPEDGRALALAVAAEELLRASWAELALRGPHSAQTAPPPEVRAIVEQAETQPRAPRRFKAFGARLAFEHYLGGQTHYGADLFAAVPVGPVAAVLLGVGARRALTVQAPHGSIAASGYCAELGVSLTFLRQKSSELGAFVSGRALRLTFQPAAAPSASASPASGLAVTSRVGLALAFGSPGLLRSYSTLGAGLPLRSFSAADSGGTVTGVSELELFASTGLALELP